MLVIRKWQYRRIERQKLKQKNLEKARHPDPDPDPKPHPPRPELVPAFWLTTRKFGLSHFLHQQNCNISETQTRKFWNSNHFWPNGKLIFGFRSCDKFCTDHQCVNFRYALFLSYTTLKKGRASLPSSFVMLLIFIFFAGLCKSEF